MVVYLLSLYGEVSERFKELVLKTSDSLRAVGSNPTLSAKTPSKQFYNYIV